MAGLAVFPARVATARISPWAVRALLRPLQALIAAPHYLFLFTLALMLFHSPDSPFPPYDRFAFALLVFVMILRACVRREALQLAGPVTWPLLAILVMSLGGVLTQPYDAENWSMFAAKWLVPFVFYQLASYVFADAKSLRQFEIFSLIPLAYLSWTAVFFMAGAKDLVFPRYILDEGLGIHADRARGPFLQAVANGIALNLLGLVALDSFRRKRLRGVWAVLLLSTLPLAIVATKTRAVWISFAASILILCLTCQSRHLRQACLALSFAGVVGLSCLLSCTDHHRSLSERLEEAGPVKFRVAVYQSGWEMFLEKPLLGWGARDMQDELASRVRDFHQERYFFHNTYLEILVQYGLAGLALYLWMIVDLIRLGRSRPVHTPTHNHRFLDAPFRRVWLLMLGVYLFNGSFVGMNYQFVNGFLFTMAGVLAAQNRCLARSRNVFTR